MHIGLASIYHFSVLKGGNERYTHNLALGLLDRGHEVTYYTGACRHHAYPYRIIILPVHSFLTKPLPSFSWFHPREAGHLDLFHACGSGLPLLAAAASIHSHLPTVLTFQAPTNPQNLLTQFGSVIENVGISRVFDTIIATSPQNQKLLSAKYPRLLTAFIPLMVSELFYRTLPAKSILVKKLLLQPQSKNLLFIARLDRHHYYKGLEIALLALQQLPPVYHLYVIGAGGQEPLYRQQTAKLGLSNRVSFLGEVADPLVPEYIKAADCFLFPSTSNSEGFGLALVEAMAVGTPTITTTAIGSYSWLAPKGITNFIPPKNPAALALTIQKLLGSPPRLQLHRAQCFARTLSRESMVGKTLAVYHEILARTHH
jgi:glycosyltransferase involved in cell wall biosynthesis